MQLVERHIFSGNQANVYKQMCFNAARLYNYCNYYVRQAYFGKVQKFSENELIGLLSEFNQEDYRNLHAQSSVQTIRLLFKNWKSYFTALKQYNKTPSLFKGRPNLPGFKKKDGYGVYIFTKRSVRYKNGYVYFPKSTNLPPIKTKTAYKDIAQVRIVPQYSCFAVEVVYNYKPKINENIRKELFLSIDLGVNNFVTSINNAGQKPLIVNGKNLKSKNQWYNKYLAQLHSYVGNKGTSNRIGKLTLKRNNYINDKLHKISRFIINYCLDHEIGTIIIGKNDGWKQNSKMNAKANQHFIGLPHDKFIDKLSYKAKMCGIDIITHEESYSSKIDHFVYETMEHHETYLGNRKKRGLFQSSSGVLINADVNGAIGIARKVVGDSVVKPIADSGLAFNPHKINIL